MNFKKYLPITWSVLYVGLNHNWLNTKEVVMMINNNSEKLNCDEETLVNINVNEDEKMMLLEILSKQLKTMEDNGVQIWQLANLISIEQSQSSIHEKLKEVELQWSRYDYPESWRNFIYYMPNEKANSEFDVYKLFLEFLIEEKKKLNWDYYCSN